MRSVLRPSFAIVRVLPVRPVLPVLWVLFAAGIAGSCASAPTAPPVRSGFDLDAGGGAVVSVDELASRAGASILARGGNAIDAAVATAFALAVTWPEAGNLGGGGFMLARGADGAATCFDYRETAPAAATPDMFLGWDGKFSPYRARIGELPVGVPGTVAGLALAHQRLGTMPWAELVRPARLLARDGFEIGDALAESLARSANELAHDSEARRIFLHEDGTPKRAGERLVQTDLARTLEDIERDGPQAFYTGAVASCLIADLQARGSMMTQADLATYQAKERAPLVAHYRGKTVIAVPPPTSGGFVLLSALAQLEAFDLPAFEPGGAPELHLFAETLRRAFLDRALRLGDPDHVAVDLAPLLAQEHIDALVGSIDQEQATPSDAIAGDLDGTLPPEESAQTTHFSVVDRFGNAVANTYTLEESFGAKIVARGTGMVLNNELHDFNVVPGQSDRAGRIGTAPNAVAPGKRPLSSMCPVIVCDEHGALLLVAGSPGGRTIPSTVLRLVTGRVDHDLGPRELVELGRVHHGLYPDLLQVEERVALDAREVLVGLGHDVRLVPRQGDAHLVARDPRTGRLRGTADRRLAGSVAIPGL